MNWHCPTVPAAVAALALLAACAVPAPLAGGPSAPRLLLEPAATRAAAPQKGSLAPAEGDRRVAIGVGFTDGPSTFLFSGDADFYQSDRVAIGPTLLLGFDDNTAILSPTFHGKFVFPIERSGDQPQFLPFVQGGAGLTYVQKDRPGRDDELGFVMQAGGGLEARFDEHYALSSTVLVNVMPAKVLDERAYWSWQLVQFSFRF